MTFDAFGDNPSLARQDLRKWAWVMKNRDYHTFHTSYALLWLQALMQYYDYTGDIATVKELSPYVYELLDRFTGYRGKNGLISEAPNYMFMDWVNIGGFGAHHPPAVIGQGYMTAFYYRALEDAARVAELAGDPARARDTPRCGRTWRRPTTGNCGTRRRGCTGTASRSRPRSAPNKWLPADKDIQTWSAQNNVLAVLYDLAPEGPAADGH